MIPNLRDTVLSATALRSIQNKSRFLINIVRAWISFDATGRKRAETFRRRYVEGGIAAQEAERKRISLDLHDSVSQLISSAKFELQRIESHQIDRTGKLEAEIGSVLTLLEKANEEVRTIARNLRPTVLDDFGFEAAIRILCSEDPRLFKSGYMTILNVTMDALKITWRHYEVTNTINFGFLATLLGASEFRRTG